MKRRVWFICVLTAGRCYTVFGNLDLAEFPLVEQWHARLNKRPAFKKGLDIPVPSDLKEQAQDRNFIAGNKELIRQWMTEERKT